MQWKRHELSSGIFLRSTAPPSFASIILQEDEMRLIRQGGRAKNEKKMAHGTGGSWLAVAGLDSGFATNKESTTAIKMAREKGERAAR